MRFVGWFQIVVGVAVAVLWAGLLVTGQVPEVSEGRVDIWFHIVAELAMAGLLISAGRALLRRAQRAALLSALALGTVGYSAVNSPGYYAQTGDWAVVGMFGLVLFVGSIIDRVGRRQALVGGLLLLGLSVLAVVWTVHSVVLTSLALFGIGLGWNFSFVAATAEAAEQGEA
jgi:hypothetical protein